MSHIKIISTYGVLHAADETIIRRGITVTEEIRDGVVVYVVDGSVHEVASVRRLLAPTRLLLPDGSYVMP